MRFHSPVYSTRVCAVAGLLLIPGWSASTIAYAQGGASPPTGGRTLVSLNLAGTQLGTLPPEIDLQTGALDVVDRNGRRMLRAASATALLVNLPQRLPRDFLLELELIPKITSTSEDFSVEGTREQDQGDQSTNLIWYSSSVRAVGGGSQFDAPMPPSMHGAVAGVPTQVAIWVQDRLMRVYTNGQLTQTIPNRRFVRNPFVRVFLGGQDDDQEAVYLASLRIADMGSSTATVTSALGGTNVPGQQPGGGSGSGQIGPNSSGSTSGPAPVANAITNISVIDTPAGPVVSWVGVPTAAFTVQRWLIANPPCCFNTSPLSPPITASSWQDTPLATQGTYIYRVTSVTSSGSTFADAQFNYVAPGSLATPQQLPTSPATTSPIRTSTSSSTTSGGGSTTSGAGSTTSSGGGSTTTGTTLTALPATTPAATGAVVTNAGRYRVTLTGLRASVPTLENASSGDGSGDEVYAAAAAVVWDRSTSTVRSRATVTTREYGQLVSGASYANRIQAGTMTPNGGIWTGNGVEQIPAQYDPAGSSIPAHTTDRFPILVWEGVLQDGVEAVLVIPSLWERDIDPSLYSLWSNKWATMSLPPHILSPAVMAALGSSQLSYVPLAAPGLPIAVPIPDMTANVRDLPIGMVPNPPAAPVGADYVDRHVFITREKLGALQTVGASTLLPISYSVTTSIFAGGSYTLYLRIERLQ